MNDLNELVYEVEALRYVPTPGTIGDLLISVHPSAEYFARASLAGFARSAYISEGLWWLMALECDQDCLAGWEATYVAVAWRRWIEGSVPFRRVSHGVS